MTKTPLNGPKPLRLALLFASVLLFAVACGGGALSEEAQATIAVAEQNQATLNLSDDLVSTELLDGNSGAVTTLGEVVTGDRPILVWYWAPDCPICRGHASDVEQFARDNEDILQVVGVGSQSDFQEVQQFLNGTAMETATMLWEATGKVWQLNNVRTNSAMQLYSHDLSQQSGIIFFNNNGRSTVLDAAVQTPWAPTSRLDQ